MNLGAQKTGVYLVGRKPCWIVALMGPFSWPANENQEKPVETQ